MDECYLKPLFILLILFFGNSVFISVQGIQKKNVQCFDVNSDLNSGLDAGDSFSTALSTENGLYQGKLVLNNDFKDYYSLNLQTSGSLNINMTPPEGANYNLELYDPEKILVKNQTAFFNNQEFISISIVQTGLWYIVVVYIEYYGTPCSYTYQLGINFSPNLITNSNSASQSTTSQPITSEGITSNPNPTQTKTVTSCLNNADVDDQVTFLGCTTNDWAIIGVVFGIIIGIISYIRKK
jgi:hypothetical protein